MFTQLLLLVIGESTVAINGATTRWDTTFLQLGVAPITLRVLRWMYPAYSNLYPPRARRLTSSPTRAVVSIFIPCVNFVAPFRALPEIARSSVPLEAALLPVYRPSVGSIPRVESGSPMVPSSCRSIRAVA